MEHFFKHQEIFILYIVIIFLFLRESNVKKWQGLKINILIYGKINGSKFNISIHDECLVLNINNLKYVVGIFQCIKIILLQIGYHTQIYTYLQSLTLLNNTTVKIT